MHWKFTHRNGLYPSGAQRSLRGPMISWSTGRQSSQKATGHISHLPYMHTYIHKFIYNNTLILIIHTYIHTYIHTLRHLKRGNLKYVDHMIDKKNGHWSSLTYIHTHIHTYDMLPESKGHFLIAERAHCVLRTAETARWNGREASALRVVSYHTYTHTYIN